MSNDDIRRALAAIHELQVETAEKVGQFHGRLHGIEADVSAVRSGFQGQGLTLAAIQQVCATRGDHCERRFKRLSRAVGAVAEDTGVLHIDEVRRRTRWSLLAKIGAGLLALLSVAAACYGALASCSPDPVVPTVPVVVPVEIPVEAPTEQLESLTERVEDLQQRLPRMDWFNIGR